MLDFGLGVRVRVTRHTEPRPSPSDPIFEAAEHFYGCFLQEAWDAAARGGPAAPGPFDQTDPYYLTLKAATFSIVRRLMRGRCVTHDREDREGFAGSTAAVLAAWAPIVAPARSPIGPGPARMPLWFLTLAPAGVLPMQTCVGLPLPWTAPSAWTPVQKSAVDALVAAVGPAYARWNSEVFDPAQRLARLPPAQVQSLWTPRLRAVADAWADWWRFHIGPWWEADAVGDQLVKGFEGVAARYPRLERAWRRALRDHGFRAAEAAQDIADARVGAGDSVALTADGRAVLNFRGALEAESNRQARESRRRRHEIAETDLRARGEGASGPEELAADREYVGDAVQAIRAVALAARRALRQRFRTLAASPPAALHHRVARRLAWLLWRGASVSAVARRTGVHRPNLATAWKAWRKVLESDPEVRRLLSEVKGYRELG